MTGPGWEASALAAVMIVIALYCAGRLAMSVRRRRRTEVDADAVHAVMGVAMAGMFVPRLSPLAPAAWAAVFGAGVVWFGWRSVGVRRGGARPGRCCPHPLPHLVECVAMLYMLLALPGTRMAAGASMPGMAAAGGAASLPALPAVLALFMVGYVVWTADRLTALARAGQGGGGAGPVLAPRLAACYKIAMSMAMGYMLVLMI